MAQARLLYKKLISKEDKSWFSLINYHPTIPKIYGLPKPHQPDIPLRPIISTPHNIAKLLAITLSPLLGSISDVHINNSGLPLNKFFESRLTILPLTLEKII